VDDTGLLSAAALNRISLLRIRIIILHAPERLARLILRYVTVLSLLLLSHPFPRFLVSFSLSQSSSQYGHARR
jgi:hypothetical protein